jgi:hypothetical protein
MGSCLEIRIQTHEKPHQAAEGHVALVRGCGFAPVRRLAVGEASSPAVKMAYTPLYMLADAPAK